ncbi:MAG: RNA polymerase sigma-70 factor (ECF subfamily) [Flavobacteriales bacterium]|jgi:RNA polymerase sigma-70 factor (ECF subfamily)
MLLDHDDTNDVVQNTFIKAWKGIKNFRGDAKISTWLTRIAYNESINFLNKRKKIAGVDFEQVSEKLDNIISEDDLYTGDEIQQILQLAIATLPEKQKAVFIMKYYKEMKYREMSEITETSEGALKASYHLAVKKIEYFVNQY